MNKRLTRSRTRVEIASPAYLGLRIISIIILPINVGGGCEFHVCTGGCQTFIGKIIPSTRQAGDASFTRVRERVRRL